MNYKNSLSRRSFIQKTAGSTVAMSIPPIAFPLKSDESSKDRHTENVSAANAPMLDPLIPFNYFPDLADQMIGYIKEMRSRYGFRRFILTAPSKEFRYTGFPDRSVFEAIGRDIVSVKKALAGVDVEIGWWCVTTIRIGKGPFQSIVRMNGSIANEACCPLDKNYQKTFSEHVATVVRIARPFWINFEDDYHLNGGCFCPLHLEEFARRQGKYYPREVLQELFNSNRPERFKLLEAWGKLSRESLAELAASVRNAVDEIAPETRLCLCQSGASEREGNFTEIVTKAFAGKTRPAVRVRGASYFSDTPQDIPLSIFSTLWDRQTLPADFELIHESDTFPHTRFFISSSKLKTMMTAVLAYGLDDSLFYATQYLENPLEERGYCEMFLAEAKRFATLRSVAKKSRVEGCEIFRRPGTSSNWTLLTGRMGIPHTASGGKVKLVAGTVLEQLSDAEIRQLLSGHVFLDGQAASVLTKMGYSDLIGADVFTREDTVLPPFFEGVRHPDSYRDIQNRLMYNYVWAFGKSRDAFFQIRPHDGAEVLTDFLDSSNKPSFPGLIRFKNKAGGRVAVMSFNLDDSYTNSRSISLFNYSKKVLLRETIEWLADEPLPVFVEKLPNVFCIFTRAEANDYAVVVLSNLCSDTFESIPLALAPEWRRGKCDILSQSGDWRPAKTTVKGDLITVDARLGLMDPVILRFSKRS